MELYFYFGVALFATSLFVLKMIALLYGMDNDFDLDSTHTFEVLSLQSILATLMGIGWAGVALNLEFAIFGFTALIISLFFGIIFGLFSSVLLYGLRKLNYAAPSAVPALDSVGTVYLTIPAKREGMGKVELIVDRQKKIIDAVTDNNDSLISFTQVKVSAVLSANLVLVQKN